MQKEEETMKIGSIRFVVSAGLAALGAAAQASTFTSGSLVVMRCTNGVGAESIALDEYNVSGASPTLIQTISIASSGADAVTTPGLLNHDRHLHRSLDGQWLTFAGFNKPFGGT